MIPIFCEYSIIAQERILARGEHIHDKCVVICQGLIFDVSGVCLVHPHNLYTPGLYTQPFLTGDSPALPCLYSVASWKVPGIF